MLRKRIEAREIPTEENLSGGRRSDRKVGKRRPRRYVWSRSVVSSEIATTVWHDGYTCTIVRWIRGHPPQTWYTHQRRAERWSRSERKSGRYEIKGDKPGLRLLGLSHEIQRVERMYYRRYYYAFATPPDATSWRTVRQTGFCLLLSLFLRLFLLHNPGSLWSFSSNSKMETPLAFPWHSTIINKVFCFVLVTLGSPATWI